MDLAPYRARRILFSWTAYAFGLGRPFWILQAYALQNVVCWLVMAGLLTRWLRPVTGRGLALWVGCLFSHGLLWSVRFALLDGPSLLLTMVAIVAVERGYPLWSSAIVGVNALGRETNVIALLAQPLPRVRREWGRLLVALGLAALPTLIWLDFLRAIYRSTTLAGTNTFVFPGAGIVESWQAAFSGLAPGPGWAAGRDARVLALRDLRSGSIRVRETSRVSRAVVAGGTRLRVDAARPRPCHRRSSQRRAHACDATADGWLQRHSWRGKGGRLASGPGFWPATCTCCPHFTCCRCSIGELGW